MIPALLGFLGFLIIGSLVGIVFFYKFTATGKRLGAQGELSEAQTEVDVTKTLSKASKVRSKAESLKQKEKQ